MRWKPPEEPSAASVGNFQAGSLGPHSRARSTGALVVRPSPSEASQRVRTVGKGANLSADPAAERRDPWEPLCAAPASPSCTAALTSAPARCEATSQFLSQQLRAFAERLSSAERERNLALAALRDSERQLQDLQSGRPTPTLESAAEALPVDGQGDVQVQHYRVLVELLTTRCRLLEQWLEEEATTSAARDADAQRALAELQEQTVHLSTAIVEQQRAFKAKLAEMTGQQEKMTLQHRAEIELCKQDCERQRKARCKITAEVKAMQEDFRCREEAWLQEWAELHQSQANEEAAAPIPGGQALESIPEALDETWSMGNADGQEDSTGMPCGSDTDQPGVTVQRSPQAMGLMVLPDDRRKLALTEFPSGGVVCGAAADAAAGAGPPLTGGLGEHRWRQHTAGPGLLGAGLLLKPAADQVQAEQPPAPASPQFGAVKPRRAMGPAATPTKEVQEESAEAAACTGLPEELVLGLRAAADERQAARAWAKIGQAQQRRKNFAEARTAYYQAVQLDPSQHGCLANLAQLEAHAGDVAAAAELLARAIALDPANAAYAAFGRWLESGQAPSTSRSGAAAEGQAAEAVGPKDAHP